MKKTKSGKIFLNDGAGIKSKPTFAQIKMKKEPLESEQPEEVTAVVTLPEVKEVKEVKNEFETKIIKVCRRNRFPLRFKDGTVNGKVPDFINRERMKIVEIYNPERTDEEVYARMKAFHICRYKVAQLTKDDLTRPDWDEFYTRVIGSLLK